MDEESLRSVPGEQTQDLAIDVFSNSIPNVSVERDRHFLEPPQTKCVETVTRLDCLTMVMPLREQMMT